MRVSVTELVKACGDVVRMVGVDSTRLCDPRSECVVVEQNLQICVARNSSSTQRP